MSFLKKIFNKSPSVHDLYFGKISNDWKPKRQSEKWLKEDGYNKVVGENALFVKKIGVYPYYQEFDYTVHYQEIRLKFGEDNTLLGFSLNSTGFRGITYLSLKGTDMSESDIDRINIDYNDSVKQLSKIDI